MTFLRISIALVAGVLSGCASDAWLKPSYHPPTERAAQLTAEAPAKSRVPVFVEICEPNGWERMVVLGKGLVSSGAIVTDAPEIVARPTAWPLPSTSELAIPSGRPIKFRFRAHPEVVSGGPFTGATIAMCAVPVQMTPEAGKRYRAIWRRDTSGCTVTLASVDDAGVATPLQPPPTDDKCWR